MLQSFSCVRKEAHKELAEKGLEPPGPPAQWEDPNAPNYEDDEEMLAACKAAEADGQLTDFLNAGGAASASRGPAN